MADTTYPRLTATFRPQRWRNDDAVPDGGEVRFDATSAFLSLSLEEARGLKEHNEGSDNLADGLEARVDHDGPFEVDVDVDEWLAANGFKEGRASLTKADLDTLRERFDVQPG